MRGRARAPAAGTILNALATGRGAAFAIDVETTATVTLEERRGAEDASISGTVAEDPEADTRLIERCVERVLDRYAETPLAGRVETESEVPMAAGLKSSSAAANATVLATLEALDPPDPPSREEACRIGVEAARDAGVTVTGAFDDASASMLGGVTVTDNDADELRSREPIEWDVLVWTPDERAYSADADVERCRRIAPVADAVFELALAGEYASAMTINGFAFSAALSFPTEPMMEALPAASGVSLSGTGPSVVAVGEREALGGVREQWEQRGGTTCQITTQNAGARTT
jgi:shikimate kinase